MCVWGGRRGSRARGEVGLERFTLADQGRRRCDPGHLALRCRYHNPLASYFHVAPGSFIIMGCVETPARMRRAVTVVFLRCFDRRARRRNNFE